MSLRKPLTKIAVASIITLAGLTTAYAAEKPISQPNAAGNNVAASASDQAITAKVVAALSSSKFTGVVVTTTEGVVQLTGTLPSEELRQTATKIAAGVDGVRGVDYKGLSLKANS